MKNSLLFRASIKGQGGVRNKADSALDLPFNMIKNINIL